MFSAPNAYHAIVADNVLHENSPKFTFGNKVNVGKLLDTPGSCLFLKYIIAFNFTNRMKQKLERI